MASHSFFHYWSCSSPVLVCTTFEGTERAVPERSRATAVSPVPEMGDMVQCYSSRHMKTLNERFSELSMRRRYEVWFLRFGLSDGSGAWWFRYLLMNLGRGGCAGDPLGQAVQVWATWFPREGRPETWIQGFPIEKLGSSGEELDSANLESAASDKAGLRNAGLSRRGASPFFLEIAGNRIRENECRGCLEIEGQRVRWDLRYRSTFRTELSSKGWIGFSRTPHSDATFSGEIVLNGRVFRGEPLGLGVQGHNCGYRHRDFWTWTHIHFLDARGRGSTFEALAYEMPLGMRSRTAVLWHDGEKFTFRKFREAQRDSQKLKWNFECVDARGARVEVSVCGREGFAHRLPYVKTDCSGRFEVANDSLALARLVLQRPGKAAEELVTDAGAVLEMVGN